MTGLRLSASCALLLLLAACTGSTVAPTPAPTVAPTPSQTVAPTPSPTVAPTASPTVAPTAGPTPSPTAAGPSDLLDDALADAGHSGGIPNVTAAQLRNDADAAIQHNLAILPAGYPSSVDDVAQVKYCTSGQMPSADEDLARELGCSDTAIWAYIGWTLTGSDDFITAFREAIYFLEANAPKYYVDAGLDRIRGYSPQ